ncbi:MAG: DUF1015 domain-containing protein [Oscillospiraceae bacterium]|nr:DUF1015 domain-containing protein [Oscillospiraceae bacterium]
MAEIRGFKGLRYNTEKAGDLNTLVCPPYDIISPKQREEYVAKNPLNIIRLELPQGGDERYAQAGKLLKEWTDGGVLTQDGEDGIYVYEMKFTALCEKKSLKGFVCLVKLTDFSQGIVLPHEETLSKAKTDRFNLMSETNCNFSQIYSLYKDENNSVSALVDSCSKGEPDLSVTDGDGTVHNMWRVTDSGVIENLTNAFTDKKIYIADGHHRYETALNFHKHLCEKGAASQGDLSGHMMMMLVDMENAGLVVFPTHRIVRNLEGFDINKILDGCKPYFDIKETPDESSMKTELDALYAGGKKAFALYTGAGKCHIMTLKAENAVKDLLPNMSDAYCGLDVSVLHNLVLERIFGIDKENMANQKNLIYTRVLSEALTAVDIDGADCSFILNPTKVSEISDVAAAGEKMPQKSTYFYPKLVTGLVVNKLI